MPVPMLRVLLCSFCLALLHSFFVFTAAAQHCEVTDYTRAGWPRVDPLPVAGTTAKATGIAYIPLQFHVIYGSGPDGANWYEADTSLVDKAIDTVNTQFLAAGIQFCKAGPVDKIFNDTFCNQNHYSMYYRFKPDYPDTTVIHVFIPVSYGPSAFLAGYSFAGAGGRYDYGRTGPAVTIMSSIRPTSRADKYVLTHELGHYFGLLHLSNYTYKTGYELVDGSNCDSTGDFCCGTPAEYGDYFVDTNCMLIKAFSSIDANGDTLVPDPKNIMSANTWSMGCREYFSPDQIDRIKYYHKTYLNYLACPGSVSAAEPDQAVTSVAIVPNPTVSTQQLKITCGQAAPATINLYNITGQLVQEVYQGDLQAGLQYIDCDMAALPAGVYFYRITIGNQALYRKAIRQ